MFAIQEHPNLKMIFRLNKILGFSPAATDKKAQFASLWDVIILAVTFASFYFTVGTLYRILDTAKISAYSQLLVICLIYCNVMFKTANLTMKKRHIMEIFNKMNDVIAFKPFCEFQKPVLDLVCTRIRNTVLILIAIALCCISGMVAAMASNLVTLQIKLSTNSSNVTLTKEDEITQQLSHAHKFSKSDFIVMFIHTIFNLMLPIKNIGMDSLMLFCHYFVVQQLNLLTRQFKNTKNYAYSTEKHTISYGLNLNSWMEMFNKVKK